MRILLEFFMQLFPKGKNKKTNLDFIQTLKLAVQQSDKIW